MKAGTGVCADLEYCEQMSAPLSNGPEWIPRVDVYVSMVGDLNILAELGPLRREDIDLEVNGDGIRIKGLRPNLDQAINGRYLVNELRWGAFERTVAVPPGFDLAMASANYQSGLLRIMIPARRR
jgi:HSP20 family molecular chaperone IbpA